MKVKDIVLALSVVDQELEVDTGGGGILTIKHPEEDHDPVMNIHLRSNKVECVPMLRMYIAMAHDASSQAGGPVEVIPGQAPHPESGCDAMGARPPC